MTFHKDIPYLKHILDAIKDIESSTRNVTKNQFNKNKDTKDANIRRIEIIGEAVKNLSSDFRNKYSYVSWKDIAGMRDKLMHHYFGISTETVWKTIIEDIPKLKTQISKILKDEDRIKN